MCGIAGFLENGGLHRGWADALTAMTDAIRLRGPDHGGVWRNEERGVALGHRRLSVVDLSCLGHQPMTSTSERFVAVYNGEIYNFRELRAGLEAEGAAFRGRSDTEVLLAGFERWGIQETVGRAIGMFAFAVWDRQNGVLCLGRDRFGEKPLYCGWLGDTFLFGSELKALRAHPRCTATIDRGALSLYMRYGYVPAPYSIYAGIQKVTPGELWRIRPEAPGALERTPYWSAPTAAARALADPFRGSYADAVDAVDGQLRRTVGRQMVADVPLGAFLSGGIDSSMIVAQMQAQSGRAVQTFTIGYEENDYDEAAHAREVARHLGTDHRELHVSASDALSLIPRLPAIYDEPFADASQIPMILVASLARAQVTVALSGDGGDELFAGYNRYRWVPAVWDRVGKIPRGARRALAGAIHAVPARAWDRGLRAVQGVLPHRHQQRLIGDKLHKLAGVLAVRSRDDMYRDIASSWHSPSTLVRGAAEPPSLLMSQSIPAEVDSFVSRMMLLDSMSYLPDDILVKVDRAAMSVSLETRAPFLDHEVFDLAWRMPLDFKLDRRGTGKRILRDVLARYIPRPLFERPKMGFGVPVEHWLRGPLRGWAEDLLAPDTLRAQHFLDADLVHATWRAHASGARNWQYRLWNVLMFQAWLAQHPST